ncbi:MAG TPA: zinc-ribbon domain-containing protein, partial [Myxococcota bacterium]
MKFECDSCHAQYMIADEKVGKRGVKVKCKKCQHVIIVRPDGTPATSAAALAKAAETKPVEVRAEKAETDAAPLESARPAMTSPATGKKKAARIEEPQETLAQPPPPGLQLTEPPDDDNGAFAGGFQNGGPTDPGVPEMEKPAAKKAAPPPPSDDIDFNDEPVPPPPPLDEPENTGPNLAPAPVSLFGDATQLTKNPMDPLASEPEGRRLDDGKTELGGLPQMTGTPGVGPDTKPSGRGGKNDATIVQAQAPPDLADLEPPAP